MAWIKCGTLQWTSHCNKLHIMMLAYRSRGRAFIGYSLMRPKLRPSLVNPLMEAKIRKKHHTEKAMTPKKTKTSSSASNIEFRNGCNGGSTIT